MSDLSILILVSSYDTMRYANASIIKNVAESLVARGDRVTVLAPGDSDCSETINGVRLERIRRDTVGLLSRGEGTSCRLAMWAAMTVRRLRAVVGISHFPDVEPFLTKRFYRKGLSLVHEQNPDCVIGVFRSFSAVAATIMLKEEFPQLIAGAYYLDILDGQKPPRFFSEQRFRKLCQVGENKQLPKLDFILMPPMAERIYSNESYSGFNGRIRYLDFPSFVKPIDSNEIDSSVNTAKCILVFAGTLDKVNRNPEYLLRVLSALRLCESIQVEMHFYCRGDCGDLVDAYCERANGTVVRHGVIPKDELAGVLQSASALVNISNRSPYLVPSKIFELFATGKPIINIVSNADDCSLVYFERYPASLTLFEWESVSCSVEKLKQWLLLRSADGFSACDYSSQYVGNTPDYAAMAIDETIREAASRL